MTSYSDAYKQLNLAQRQAVDTIDGPVLVIAGPGTGKTQLLSLRVANILQRTDAQPGNILCLTYTESGQAAMRRRLLDLLGSEAKKLEIHTFHGFGSHLINRFPDYFPSLSGARPADDLALYEVMVHCLEQLPRNNPLSKMSYGQFIYQGDALSRISQLKQAGIMPKQAIARAERDSKWASKVGRIIAQAFNDMGRVSLKGAEQLRADLNVITNKSAEDDLPKSCIEELKDALASVEETGKTSALSLFKKKWLSTEDGVLYFRPADQLKKIQALAELYDLYESELRDRRLYDYDDMILYALQALETNQEFRAQVQETYQYILADEYQDTNTAQASIITIIADSPVNEGRPNVLVVGDDDQAIYGFQGALGDVMLHFRERWREVKIITLKDNYRSTQHIIDAARAVIQQGQNRLEYYYEDIDKSLTARAEYTANKPLLVETTSTESALQKAVMVAKSTNPNEQLAIIATKHKYLRALADMLDQAKVSYYYEGREDILRDVAVQQLLLIASAVTAIQQDELANTSYILPELITTDLLKVSRQTAWEVAITARIKNEHWWEVLKNLKRDDALRAADTLQASTELIDPNRALVSLRSLAQQYDLRVLRKIKALVKHAEKYYGRPDISLLELLHYTQLSIQAGITLSEKVVQGRADARIVLLSAHKSKGLEFDRVYILHADYNTWFKEKGRRNNLVWPEGWKYLEPVAESNDDRLRLLYVVMTRAKRELTFISSKSSTNLPGLDDIETSQYVGEQLEAFSIKPQQSWQEWYRPQNLQDQSQLSQLLQPVLKNYRLSPSHLTTFFDVVHGGPATFLVHSLLGVPKPPHPEALFGNRVHDALHYAQRYLNKTGVMPSKTDLTVYIQQKYEISDMLVADVVSTVTGFLKHTAIIKPGGMGEYNFASSTLSLGDIQVTGTADHYMKLKEHLVVTDFKTGRALNSWHVTEDYYKQKLHRFRQQLFFYELLFRLSQKFNDIESVDLQVAFVEPSRRDIYYQLSLDSNDNELLILKKLIQAVWHKIMAADIPDTSGYSPDFAGIKAFENDLITLS